MSEIRIDRDLKWALLTNGQSLTKEEIRSRIVSLTDEKTKQNNKNSSAKVALNSIYGVLGFKPFLLYNVACAEAITLMSQSLIKYTIQIVDVFFKEVFPRDKELQKKLGIDYKDNIDYNTVNYADTDSIMVTLSRVFKPYFEEYYKNYTIDENIVGRYKLNPELKYHRKAEFYLRLHEYGLKPYITNMLAKFVKRYNGFDKHVSGNNTLKLGLEQVNHSIFFQAKKMYAKNPLWDDGKLFKDLEKVQTKGLATNRSEYPKWARGKLTEVVTFILDKKQDMDSDDLAKKIRSIYLEFENIGNIDQICQVKRVNDYEKYVLCDTTEVKLAESCPEQIRSAAYYNYILYNSKHKAKYTYVKGGTKVMFYCTEDKEMGVFGFPVGRYPYEFAPKMDIDLQFKKIFLNPVNNMLKALGYSELKSDLLILPSLW